MHLLIFPNFFDKKKNNDENYRKKKMFVLYNVYDYFAISSRSFFFPFVGVYEFWFDGRNAVCFSSPLKRCYIYIYRRNGYLPLLFEMCLFFRSFTSERQIWFILGNACIWRALLLRCHPEISPVFPFLFTCST